MTPEAALTLTGRADITVVGREDSLWEGKSMNEVPEKPAGSVQLERRWFTVAEVAEMLGYGESKVRTLVISGDLRSCKDGGSRRILPQWIDEYVARRADSEWRPAR